MLNSFSLHSKLGTRVLVSIVVVYPLRWFVLVRTPYVAYLRSHLRVHLYFSLSLSLFFIISFHYLFVSLAAPIIDGVKMGDSVVVSPLHRRRYVPYV